jgi:hypothetical protein
MLRDLIALPDTSRVWVYQANRPLTYDEIDIVRPMLYDFAHNWQSHGIVVQSYANVFHMQFFVIVADESNLGVSGCSIDSSVHLMKTIESTIGVDLFDRMLYTYFENEEIKMIHHIDFKEAYDNGKINDDTLMFNNLVESKEAFIQDWVKPLKDSWHSTFVN